MFANLHVLPMSWEALLGLPIQDGELLWLLFALSNREPPATRGDQPLETG